MVENQKGQKMKVLRSDNGSEYTSIKFKAYLEENNIQHQLCIPGRPEQNGVAKRTHSIRLQADMSKEF